MENFNISSKQNAKKVVEEVIAGRKVTLFEKCTKNHEYLLNPNNQSITWASQARDWPEWAPDGWRFERVHSLSWEPLRGEVNYYCMCSSSVEEGFEALRTEEISIISTDSKGNRNLKDGGTRTVVDKKNPDSWCFWPDVEEAAKAAGVKLIVSDEGDVSGEVFHSREWGIELLYAGRKRAKQLLKGGF